MNYKNTLLVISFLFAIGFIAKGGYIKVKAQLAQHLLNHAWAQSIMIQRATKPWPWADTHAIARLSAPNQNLSTIVLEGISGESMAFGPGMEKTLSPSQHQIVLIGGHRDTHMAFLKDLAIGDGMELELIDGSIEYYVIEQTLVSNVDNEKLQIDSSDNSLVLVTCYPFDSIFLGGPLRYIVVARQQRVTLPI